MKTKVISILLCFVLVVTVFAGCEKNIIKNDSITTTTTTTTTTTETTTEDNFQNSQSQGDKVTRDSRLVGKWRAETKVPVDENGNTVTSRCTVVFNKDGTFTQTTTEAQARQMIIDTYLITFNCKNEKELDAYLRKNMNVTLENYVVIALANLDEDDMNVKGKWRTENKTLYQITNNGTRDVTENAEYIVLDDGKTAKIRFNDGSGGKLIMVLTKA